jgi:hypothetical protein
MLHKITGKILYNLPAIFHLTKSAAMWYNGKPPVSSAGGPAKKIGAINPRPADFY